MKFLALIFLGLGAFAFAAKGPTALKLLPGFPPEAAEVLELYGVQTDYEFLLAGGVNPDGVARALGLEVQGIKTTVASLWGRTGRDWAEKWSGRCRGLLLAGRPSAQYQQTPLLALELFPLTSIRKLVPLKIRTAEAFYVTHILNPGSLQVLLGVEEAVFANYLIWIRSGTPHVAAMVDRSVAKGAKGWDISSLLESDE